jgi:hypothetical protein
MTVSSRTGFQEFQGTRVSYVPDKPGLYAWYYRPTSIRRESTPGTLTRFLSSEIRITTHVHQRYGVRTIGQSIGETFLGAEEQAVGAAVAEAFDEAEPFLDWFFRSEQFVHFCRPVYIGIARNLYERVYSQHYLSLTDYWDDTSQVSRFIAANGQATVQNVMDRLDLPHSFALEARVRGISSKDLMVSVLETDEMPPGIGPDTPTSDSATRRALERLLQLLSDPICGRR